MATVTSIASARNLISVADLAQLLNVSRRYAREVLLRRHILRPVMVLRGEKFVFKARAEAYRRKRRRIARRALRTVVRISERAGL